MKIKTLFTAIAAIGGLLTASGASAALFDASSKVCPASSTGGILVSHVTTTETGDATGCYGVFAGNDPGPSGDGIDIDGDTIADFDFLAKYDGSVEGDIPGLSFSGGTSGSWTFGDDVTFDSDWAVVLKAGSCWAAWTFGAGTYSGGTYEVTYGTGGPTSCDTSGAAGLSHIGIYGSLGDVTVPEPTTLALLGLGLIGVGLARRRKVLA